MILIFRGLHSVNSDFDCPRCISLSRCKVGSLMLIIKVEKNYVLPSEKYIIGEASLRLL